MSKKPKIGIALGGGGARGLAHIGVLKVLDEAGIKPDVIAGTSMGSLIGAYYALGNDLKTLEMEALSFNKRKAMKELVDLSILRKSILRGKKIHNYINRLLKQAEFTDTEIPLRVIATNLSNGQVEPITKGNIARAVEASICVPGIFPPIKIGDKYLVDGGVANPTPVDQVMAMGADIAIGIDLIIKKPVRIVNNPGLAFTLLQSYEIIRNKVFDNCLSQTYKGEVVLIKPDLNGSGIANSFKFYNIREFIEEGERAAKKMLPTIKKKIEEYK